MRERPSTLHVHGSLAQAVCPVPLRLCLRRRPSLRVCLPFTLAFPAGLSPCVLAGVQFIPNFHRYKQNWRDILMHLSPPTRLSASVGCVPKDGIAEAVLMFPLDTDTAKLSQSRPQPPPLQGRMNGFFKLLISSNVTGEK